jgi:cyclophilin family peptidyl-prolyl cis-trans isomerase
MKNTVVQLILFFLLTNNTCLFAQKKTTSPSGKPAIVDTLVQIDTRHGQIILQLFKDTPLHRANMLKLVGQGFYDSTTFHRVIPSFMIQGGDPNTKDDNPMNDGQGDVGYTVPAEFHVHRYHKKGAVAGARIPNPTKASSGCQFYIVVGQPFEQDALKQMTLNKHMDEAQRMADSLLNTPQYAWLNGPEAEKLRQTNPDSLQNASNRFNQLVLDMLLRKRFKYSEQALFDYATLGGAPHLDNDYTVYGETVKGLDVVEKIVAEPRDPRDRPKADVKMTAKLLPVTAEQLEQLRK